MPDFSDASPEFAMYMADNDEPVLEPEPEHPLAKFLQDARLAGKIGWDELAEFKSETAVIDRRAEHIIEKRLASTEEWNEPITVEEPLTKAKDTDADPDANRYAWIRNRMRAMNKTADEVIDGWVEAFPHRNMEIERELRLVAAAIDG